NRTSFFLKHPAPTQLSTLSLHDALPIYWKHVVIHHTYVNVTGHDSDLNLGIFGRLTPHQPRLAFHRWQHLYLWPLYGLLAIRWQLVDDFRRLIAGRIGSHRIRRPTGADLVLLVAGKAIFFAWAFGIPL